MALNTKVMHSGLIHKTSIYLVKGTLLVKQLKADIHKAFQNDK